MGSLHYFDIWTYSYIEHGNKTDEFLTIIVPDGILNKKPVAVFNNAV